MTGGTLAWGGAFAALCAVAGLLAGWPAGYRRGLRHAAEEAEWQRTDRRWKGLADAADRPAPVRPPVPAQAPRAGPGRHRHPGGPPQHTALPVAGYLPAPDSGPWDGTITLPAPVQSLAWAEVPASGPGGTCTITLDSAGPVLEPTAVLPPPVPDPRTDSQWTREMAQDMTRWIAENITATDPVLKAITR